MRHNKLFHGMAIGFAAVMLAASPASAFGTIPGIVAADYLMIRNLPDESGDIVGTLQWGDDVTITYAPGNGWYEIYRDGGCFYVSSDFIYCTEDIEEETNDYAYLTAAAADSHDHSQDTDTYEVEYENSVGYLDDTTVSVEEESSSQGEYLGNFTLTAYCGCAICCGTAGNLTASGTVPTAGRTVAMGGVPFGTKLLINGTVYTVEDRGTAYGTVDIFFNSHSEALAFGMQSADVYQVN